MQELDNKVGYMIHKVDMGVKKILDATLKAAGYGLIHSDRKTVYTERGHQARFWLRNQGKRNGNYPVFMAVRLNYDENRVQIIAEGVDRRVSVRYLRDVKN